MSSRRLGTSDLFVFPLVLGGNTFGWTSDASESEAVLDAFVAGGGDFIDTADAYSRWKPGNVGGESELIIGEWMRTRGNRDRVVIATKVGKLPGYEGLAGNTIRAAAEESLRRLRTDYIDLYYAHADDPETPILETAEAFDDLVRSGKVRHLGLSNYSGARVAEYLSVAREHGLALPVVVQPHYNLVFREEYESDLMPVVREAGMSCAPYYSLASGFLSGKYAAGADVSQAVRKVGVSSYMNPQSARVLEAVIEIAAEHATEPAAVALAWLLTRPTIVGPIASARVVEQVPALLAATSLELTVDQTDRLTALSEGL